MFIETSYGKIPQNELVIEKIPNEPKIKIKNYLGRLYNQEIDGASTNIKLFDGNIINIGEIKSRKEKKLFNKTKFLKVKGSIHTIKLVKFLTPKVSYLVGYFYGDGGLKDIRRSKKISKRFEHKMIIGDEFRIHIEKIIIPLFLDIFNLKTKLRLERIEKGEKLYYINPTCKVVYRILTNIFELNDGPKKDISIPSIILNSNKNIRKWFVRGFFDADGDTRVSEAYVNKKMSSPRIKVKIKERKFVEQLKIFLNEDFGFGFTGPYTDNGNQWYIQTGKKDLLKAFNEKLFIHPIKRWRLKRYIALMGR